MQAEAATTIELLIRRQDRRQLDDRALHHIQMNQAPSIFGYGPEQSRSIMTENEPKTESLSDEDIRTIGSAPPKASTRDSDGVDSTDSDGVDSTDSDGVDSTDSDGVDSTDSDGVDSTDSDGVDSTDSDGVDSTDSDSQDS